MTTMIYEVFDAFRSEITAMRGDVALLKLMVGFALALNVAIILKLFIH